MPLPNLNSALAEVESPLHPFFSNNIFVVADESGSIIQCWGNRTGFHERFFDYLTRQGSLTNLFDFEGAASLHEACKNGSANFPIRKDLHLEILSEHEEFYSDLPWSGLRIFPIEGGHFLGIVNFADFLPNIFYSNENIIVLVGRDQKIRGFNENFLKVFSPGGTSSAPFLGRPLSEFIHPTLAGLEAEYLKSFEGRDAGGEWAPFYTWPDGQWLEAPEAGNFSREASGLRWKNPQPETPCFLPLPGRLDCLLQDFLFEVKLRCLSGTPPLLIATECNAKTPQAPAIYGYQAGTLVEKRGLGLKRKGLLFADVEHEQPAGESRMALEKRGCCLFVEADGHPGVSAVDFNFMLKKNTGFFLGLRGGGEVILEEIRILTRPALPEEARRDLSDVVVRLKSQPPRYCSIGRFDNLSLTSSHPDIVGYILTDVTPLQEKATRYQERYQREKTRVETLLEKSGDEFVGTSAAVAHLKAQAETAASALASVLIEGPTGSGKEVLANFIHRKSQRRNRPFVKVDCSAVPESLIESELFGHEKGAFTGAVGRKIGRFEQAEGGTLYLDEIGNLSLNVQAKLLGFLQDLSITRIGGSRPLKLDVRVIAASNTKIQALIERGVFREDLYYRINTIAFQLPPLRERIEDIPALCRKFVADFNGENSKKIDDLTPGAYQKLFNYPWPGNIRELKNVIHRACIFCEGGRIGEELVVIGEKKEKKQTPALARENYHLHHLDEKAWRALLKKHRGVVNALCRELGISRTACYDNFKRYGIDPSRFRRAKTR